MYHKVAPIVPTQWWVSADSFYRQMTALSAYDVVPLSGYDPSNPRHVVISFDGVYGNVFEFAFPILKKYNYPFELFVVGDYVGGDNSFDSTEPEAEFATIEQLKEMSLHGGRVQWHTASHRNLDKISHEEVLIELTVPAALGKRFLSPHFDWFAYPHGDHSQYVVDAVRSRFSGALSCLAGNDHDPYQLNRLTIKDDTDLNKNSVTIIVANYNYGQYLSEAMDSVLGQSQAADEIILIDDCSTDGSQEIALRYSDTVRVVLNEENLGIVGNFNKAVGMASSDYIAILGADNRMRSDYIEQCMAALDKHEDAAVAYTDMVIFGDRSTLLADSVGADQIGHSIINNYPMYLWKFPDPTKEVLANFHKSNFIHGSSMYRRAVFDQVGGYLELSGPEDHNLFMRMIDKGWRAVHVQESLIEYRQHSPNQANTVLNLQLENVQLKNNANIHNYSIMFKERDVALKERDVALKERDVALKERDVALKERDVALATVNYMRNTYSWNITAPLRFAIRILRGDFKSAYPMVLAVAMKLPVRVQSFLRKLKQKLLSFSGLLRGSSANLPALQAIVDYRNTSTANELVSDPLSPLDVLSENLPEIDINIVTFNSSRWIDDFVDSLIALDYPKNNLFVRFIDNSSTDTTFDDLKVIEPKLRNAGIKVEIQKQPNKGFGAGHNVAIKLGTAPFVLVSNIDLTFEPDALHFVAAIATNDDAKVAAWELRQKPYEHPKYYDPVTGLTNWNSHACVLLRRSAIEQIRGYDQTLFMYGEDVELSYRLRREGFKLRYCPKAVVWHYTYEQADKIKPLQYVGSTFANLYMRVKYGNSGDMQRIFPLALRLIVGSKSYSGSRMAVLRKLLRLLLVTPRTLLMRRGSKAYFPFRAWDYDMVRVGAFYKNKPLPEDPPLVTIITRTYSGRGLYLKQAILSVAHQTWPRVEHIVVEDGGNTMAKLVEDTGIATGRPVNYFPIEKLGRSAAGNKGLAEANGRWCLFLDDDDLLFADHVEVLVHELLANPDTVASYSLSWEVRTDATALKHGRYVEYSHRNRKIYNQPFDIDVLLKYNYMPIQSVLFERNLYNEFGGFEEDLDSLEDWNLWCKYGSGGNIFIFVPKITSMFRIPTDEKVIQKRNELLNDAYHDVSMKNVR